MALHLMLIVVGLARSVSGDSSLTPLETMADVTNDFGICVLQLLASPDTNTVFSPYGLVSMAVLVYEGSVGQSAAEIFNTLHLPWHRDILRIGFRDLHRYLRSYFSSEGFLKGLVFSKANVVFRPGYVEVLKFYGFHLDSGAVFKPITEPYPVSDGGNITFTTEFPETTTMEPLETTTELPVMEANKTMTDIPSTNGTMPPTTKSETTMTTDMQPTASGTEAMTGPETTTEFPTTQQDQKTQTPTTVLTTVMGETTKRGQLGTTPALAEVDTTETLKTTNEPRMTTMADKVVTTETIRETTKMETTTEPQGTEVEPTQRTTREMEMSTEQLTTMVSRTMTTLDGNSSITESPNKTDAQETTTASPTEGVEVVTISNEAAPTLEVMNMMLDTTTKTEQTVTFDVSIEGSTLKPTETTIVSSDQDEPTDEFTEAVAVSTVLVDTEVLVLTTPPGGEEEGVAMLEAFILLDNESLGTTTDNSFSKRSTQRPGVKEKENQTGNLLGGKVPLRPPPEDNLVHEVTDGVSPGSAVFSTEHSEEHTSGVTSNTGEVDIGFPTLEPDKIVFPTITEPRLPRSVNGAGWEPLGNWVVPPEWRRLPSHLWFRTPSGDRLVPALAHSARLPFVELPALHASALQVPLDDERYSLLLLLPRQPLGLKQMLHQLQWHSLRAVLRGCRLTAVRAVLPSFTVSKRVDLTAHLYKLGIRRVFDYRRANLTDLSPEPHLFVRAVEQHITVSVRKFYPAHWADAAVGEVQREFLASHPFAYFIVDRETAVALVAGTVVDPLLRDPPS